MYVSHTHTHTLSLSLSLFLSLFLSGTAVLIRLLVRLYVCQILQCIVVLNTMGLLPEEVVFVQEGDSLEPIPAPMIAATKVVKAPAPEPTSTSLLSAFGSWFAGNAADEEAQEQDEHDALAESKARECIAMCSIRDVINRARYAAIHTMRVRVRY
jgi:hypothetical protein